MGPGPVRHRSEPTKDHPTPSRQHASAIPKERAVGRCDVGHGDHYLLAVEAVDMNAVIVQTEADATALHELQLLGLSAEPAAWPELDGMLAVAIRDRLDQLVLDH